MFTPLLCASLLCAPPGPQESNAQPEQRSVALSLGEAVLVALRNDRGLERALLETEANEYDHLGSWGAFEWVLDSTLSLSQREQEGTNSFTGGAGSTVDSEVYRLDVDLRRPVTTGGEFRFHFDTTFTETDTTEFNPFAEFTQDALSMAYVQPLRRGAWSKYATSTQREAELAWKKQVEALRQARQDLILDVETRYWDLVSARELLQVSESARDLAQSQVERELTRLEAGVGTEVEVVQAQADLATRIEAVLQSRNTVQQSMDDLKVLLFRFDDENPATHDLWESVVSTTTELPRTASAEDVPSWESARLTAFENHSDLREQLLEIEISRLRHQRTLSDRLSRLDLTLTASSGGFDEDFGQAFSDASGFEFPTYSALLEYSMPLGNKSASYSERSARVRLQQATLDYDVQETTVVAEVRKATREVSYRAEAVRAAQESLRLAQRQYEAEQAKLEEGLSTTFQVLEFQQSLIEAMQRELAARVEYVKAHASLESAQGIIDVPEDATEDTTREEP